mmetsp:Transcript_66717/g.204097  ORF Transcript_66717/g.204097 Transcript_66717/m.204097 type:complete len:205 (-) Transcript_66717:441-1055(-)
MSTWPLNADNNMGEVIWNPSDALLCPIPSWPCTLLPNAHTCFPPAATTRECLEPQAIEVMDASWSSRTGKGTAWSPTRPRPSWPLAFAPQANKRPSSVVARVWSSPASISRIFNPASSPSTGPGLSTDFGAHAFAGSRLPWPSCPWLLEPHVSKRPVSVTRTVWRAPAATQRIGICVVMRFSNGAVCFTSGPWPSAPHMEEPKV